MAYGLDTQSVNSDVETERNLALKELASRQHGNIIRDESTRIKEGAAELGVDSHPSIDSNGPLASERLDFHQNYKYAPKDNKNS
jgi:hypothetical protein